MLQKGLILFVFICLFQTVGAQDILDSKKGSLAYTGETIRVDTSQVKKKVFDPERLQEYRDSDEFNYEVPEEEASIFERIWSWIVARIKDFFHLFLDDIAPVTGFLKVLLSMLPWIILTIAILLLIKYFVNVKVKGVIEKENPNVAQFHDDEDLLNNQNLLQLLNDAKNNKEYRYAVRFYYLLVLQKLTKSGAIIWQQEKTNEDYIRELKESPLVSGFIKITRLYDFVWYGGFEVSEPEFFTSEMLFKQILKD